MALMHCCFIGNGGCLGQGCLEPASGLMRTLIHCADSQRPRHSPLGEAQIPIHTIPVTTLFARLFNEIPTSDVNCLHGVILVDCVIADHLHGGLGLELVSSVILVSSIQYG